MQRCALKKCVAVQLLFLILYDESTFLTFCTQCCRHVVSLFFHSYFITDSYSETLVTPEIATRKETVKIFFPFGDFLS